MYMKKILIFVIVIFLLLLSGCETGGIKNLIAKMEFNQEIGVYTVNLDQARN
jgi:uncharacterized protein YceK